jgi:hypothetical protein
MTYCFKCRAELSDAAMIYCRDCGLWDHDEYTEQETVICYSGSAPATFVGHIPSQRPLKGKLRVLIAGVTGLLLLLGVFTSIQKEPTTREEPAPRLAAKAEGVSSTSRQNIEEARARGDARTDEAARTPSTPDVITASAAPSVTAAVKQPTFRTEVATRTEPVLTRLAIKPHLMHTRIEIVDDVERCYALPGGYEVSC